MTNVNLKVCWWEQARGKEDEELEDYGKGTNFAKVLNPNEGIEVDLTNPLCPNFRIYKKEKERLMRHFKKTLIVKLMGRQPNYSFMVKKLKQIQANDISYLENDFFLVSLKSMRTTWRH